MLLLRKGFWRVMVVTVLLMLMLGLLLPSAGPAGAQDELPVFTEDDCPRCQVAGLEFREGAGHKGYLKCYYGVADVYGEEEAGPSGSIAYQWLDPEGLSQYRMEGQGPDCVATLTGRMSCGTRTSLPGDYELHVSVSLPYDTDWSSEEKEAIKDEARALRDELAVCAESFSPHEKPIVQEERLEGTIMAYGRPLKHTRVTLQYEGDEYVTTTDDFGGYAFPVEVGEGEEYELVMHFEYVLDEETQFIISYHDEPLPVALGLRVKAGEIEALRLFVGDGKPDAVAEAAWGPIGAVDLVDMFGTQNYRVIPEAAMYVHMAEALEFYTDYLGEDLGFRLPVRVRTNVAGDTRYQVEAGNSLILVNIDHMPADHENRPEAREYHEFSHYAQDALWEGQDPRLPGDRNHGGFSNSNTADSFIEGFAAFMATVIGEYYGNWWLEWGSDAAAPSQYATQGSLETNIQPWHRGSDIAEEIAVAGVLWDLYDGREQLDKEAEASRTFQAEDKYSALKRMDIDDDDVVRKEEFAVFSIQSHFEFLDIEGVWTLEGRELVKMVAELFLAPDESGAERLAESELDKYRDNRLLTGFDWNGDGVLDEGELADYTVMKFKDESGWDSSKHFRWRDQFMEGYDHNGDGVLDEAEIVRLAAGEGMRKDILSDYDDDGDEALSRSEMLDMMDMFMAAIATLPNDNSLVLVQEMPDELTKADVYARITAGNIEDDDDVDLTMWEIWAVIRDYHPDFTSVYEDFIDLHPDKKQAIDDIFKSHGFFADVAPQNQQWDSGEEVGRAADASTEERKTRRSTQLMEGHFVKVDNEVPFYHVQVALFDDGASIIDLPSHIYEFRSSNDDGLVYIPVPPETYDAWIMVYAEDLETKNPLFLTTQSFDEHFEESLEQGYFVEYEFEIEGEVPSALPSLYDEIDGSGDAQEQDGGSTTESDSGGGPNAAVIVVPIVVVIALALVLVIARRRRTTGP